MKSLRYLFYVLGAIVVLVLAGVIAVTMLFDANKLKVEIERAVEAKTGRTLKLEGDLKLAFWPNIGASVGRASLSERGGKGTFVGLESAHVSVAVMPLLSKQIVVSGVRLDGLKATVTRAKDGRFNFDDLLAAPAAAKEKPGTPAPAPAEAGAVRFDIGGVAITHASVSYRDAQSGRALDISDLNLHTGRIADDVPGKFDLSAQLKSSAPATDARLALSGAYRFSLAKKAFALSGLDAKLEGAAAGVTGLLLTLKGDVAADPAAQTYAVSGFALSAKGARAQESFEANVTAPKLAIAPDKAGGEAVDARFALKSPQRSADGTLKLSGVAGSAKALKVARIAAQLKLTDPSLPMKTLSIPLDGSLQANLEKETLQADLTSKFDETNLKAKLGLAKFSPPAVTFDIDADRLNLDRYTGKGAAGPAPAAKGGGAAPAGGSAAADPRVDLSALKGIDAKGRVHVGALQVENAKLSDVTAQISLANGRLEVSPHSAKLYNGALAGALSADANGNRVTLKETLTNVSIGPLLRDVARKDAMEGHGNVALDVHTAGGTVGAMKKALAGTARIALRDGAVKGFDLAETLRKAKAALGSKTAQQQLAEGGKKTDFSELSGSFNIANGVAHNSDLAGKAPLFRLAGAGDIDIGNSRINYLAKPTVVSTAKGQGGKELAELNGVTVPVRLVGPFDAVKYEVDYGAVAAAVAKSKLTEKIGGGKAGAASPLDKLKGLFGK